MYSFVQAD